jgi:hypothetical protein
LSLPQFRKSAAERMAVAQVQERSAALGRVNSDARRTPGGARIQRCLIGKYASRGCGNAAEPGRRGQRRVPKCGKIQQAKAECGEDRE